MTNYEKVIFDTALWNCERMTRIVLESKTKVCSKDLEFITSVVKFFLTLGDTDHEPGTGKQVKALSNMIINNPSLAHEPFTGYPEEPRHATH